MQEQAKQFIELLDSMQLLSPNIIEELQRQVSESKTRLSPELLAKLLVDNGHLTKFQATKLIAEMKGPEETPSDNEPEELGLAPGEELGLAGDAAEKNAEEPAAKSNVAKVFVDENDPTDVEVVDVVAVEATPVAAVPVEAVETVAAVEVVDADDGSDGLDAPKAGSPKVVKPTSAVKANPWDSFRILGVGLALLLVLVAGSFLVNWALRGSADQVLTKAEESYEQRSYETAATLYGEFAQKWPAHEQVSFAKVRSALATIRKDSEGAPNPSIGLKTALETLPGISDEPSLIDQQSDLAGALIALATKFNQRADKTQGTSERKELMDEMAQLLELINDPRYVGANSRNQQAPTLQRIAEDRQRILREINRDEELAVALGQMDEKLAEEDTVSAYDVRSALINRYPLLEANEELQKRVQDASRIQQSLVSASNVTPKLSQSAPTSAVGRSFILGNLRGNGAPSLKGQVVFVKVKGSVYGLDASQGTILWRNYVGREFQNDPIRLGETSATDALICQPEKGHVSRLDGKTGETKWFVDMGSPIHVPSVENEDLFVVTLEGMIASLDLVSGQTKWAKQLPQSVDVRPGLAFGKPNLYVPGEHSNLYVLARRDGTCKEVYYLGHRKGAIVVPPKLLLGQLFVFENINTEASKIRVLATDSDGLQIRDSQILPPLDGNIVVDPQVDGRKLAVQSDLGQIVVLDVEPTLETEKVSVLASVPKNLLEPQQAWSTFGDNKLWIADTRFTQFELQVSLGKLNRVWTEHDGDTFVGPPQRFDDIIVHTRTLRGNQGSRVSAVEADSGKILWEIDLGVPVSMISAAADGKFDTVNTAGSFYKMDRQPLRSTADSDPGQGRSATLFVQPVQVGDSATVLLNQSKANQLAYYSAANSTLQVLSASFGTATPSCPPVAVGEHVAIGLDNGQFILVNPTNGSLAASPYQPQMEPGRKVQWNAPVYLPDSQTLIVASDLQKLVRLSAGDALRSLTETDLEHPLTGPLVNVAGQIAAVNSTRSGDELVFYNATSLEQGPSLSLDGRLISGPFPLPEGCILQTDSKLVSVSADGSQKWSIDFPKSVLVAAPMENAGNLICATRDGQVWVVQADNGTIVGSSDAGQGFTSAPILLPAGLLLGSDEGAVLALPVPTTRMEAP